MLISPAHAQTAGGGEASVLVSLLPIALILGIFYLVRIHSQRTRRGAGKMSREERNEQLRAELLSAGESGQSVSSGPVRKGGKPGAGDSGRLAGELFKVEEFVRTPPTSEELYLISEGGKYRLVGVTRHPKSTYSNSTIGNPNIWLVFMELDERYRGD